MHQIISLLILDADGVARDAKLVITDLQVQYRKFIVAMHGSVPLHSYETYSHRFLTHLCHFTGGYADPGPSVLFGSMYNNGKGAKITNGSWSSTFRPYSLRCRLYDQALFSQYPDILFVSSAGNFGKNQPNSSRNTIGDPGKMYNSRVDTFTFNSIRTQQK